MELGGLGSEAVLLCRLHAEGPCDLPSRASPPHRKPEQLRAGAVGPFCPAHGLHMSITEPWTRRDGRRLRGLGQAGTAAEDSPGWGRVVVGD